MAKLDYYAVLAVERSASADELKRAYRKLAMEYHPDRNPGDHKAEHKFKEINEAYDVLKDDQKRAAYDRFGHAAFENGGGGGGGFGGGGFGFEGGLGDIFEQMFGGGRRGQERRQAGADLKVAIEIELTEAFTGTKRNVRVATRATCDACNGSGSADKNATADTCKTCAGAGRVRAQQGFFVVERTCPTCSGSGRVVRNPCRVCAGAGTVPRERTVEVQIPAGIEDGTSIRRLGEGEAGPRGAPAGDLYVHVSIREHQIFERDGANIFCRVPLRMAQAALGAEIEVATIDGTAARVKIPAGTQSGEQIKLRGKGFSVLRSNQRGDMYIQVAVETPQSLTRHQRDLLEQFEAASETDRSGSPEHEGFFAKVKDFLRSVAENN